MLLSVDRSAPDVELQGAHDAPTPLSRSWRDRSAVLLFLRHFGWPFCRRHLVQVQEELGSFEERGAAVVAIGQGTGSQAARYAEEWGVSFPILGDPDAAAYQAFGMLRGGWWAVMGRSMVTAPFRSLRLIAEADLRGATLPASDVMRLPGVAVVSREGRLRFLYRSREPADLPPNDDVRAALDALVS